jgi:hypothetical protein
LLPSDIEDAKKIINYLQYQGIEIYYILIKPTDNCRKTMNTFTNPKNRVEIEDTSTLPAILSKLIVRAV